MGSDLVITKFHDSEISKSDDFNFAAEVGIEVLSAFLGNSFLDVTHSFIITGFQVAQLASPSMNVAVKPGLAFSRAEEKVLNLGADLNVPVEAAHATMDRLDTVEVRYATLDFNSEPRAFKDPITGAVSYAPVNTRTKVFVEARCLIGTPGSGVAPSVEFGWVKLAEVQVLAAATSIIDANIRIVTAEEDGLQTSAWTADQDVTFKLGSIEALKSIVRAHIVNNITSGNTVHGIRQGHANGFDSDMVDGMQPSSAGMASTLMSRDASGRAQVAAPSAAEDIARKSEVDAAVVAAGDAASALLAVHAALTNPHSATSAATASRLMLRDSSGRAKVAAPSALDDIALLSTVRDSIIFDYNTGSATPALSALSVGQTCVSMNTYTPAPSTGRITINLPAGGTYDWIVVGGAGTSPSGDGGIGTAGGTQIEYTALGTIVWVLVIYKRKS